MTTTNQFPTDATAAMGRSRGYRDCGISVRMRGAGGGVERDAGWF